MSVNGPADRRGAPAVDGPKPRARGGEAVRAWRRAALTLIAAMGVLLVATAAWAEAGEVGGEAAAGVDGDAIY